MRIRYAAMLAIVIMYAAVLIYPSAVQALFTQGGASGTAAPTNSPTSTIAVPTATSTAGNVLTESGLGNPSSATHDMIACCIEQSASQNAFLTPGWFSMTNTNNWNAGASWLNIMGHCVQPNESSASTATFGALTNDRSTGMACVLLRNTSCGQDVTGTAANTGAGSSTTLTYPAITTVTNGDALIYCSAASVTGANTTMSSNPAGLVVDVLSAGVSGTQGMFQIGHILQSTAGTVASATGTISSSQASAGAVGAVATLH